MPGRFPSSEPSMGSFGKVYEWAGQYRTGGVQKDVREFAHPRDIPISE